MLRLTRLPKTLQCLARSRAFASAASSEPKSYKIAVVGSGRMGQIRLAGMQVNPRLSVAAIIDSTLSSETQTALETQFKAPCFSSVQEAGNALDAIDGIWIATPTPTHGKLVEDCVAYAKKPGGLKAIGIEKPVGATLSEIDAAYELCAAQRVKLLCSFQRRFDPSYEKLRQACALHDRVGKIQSIHTVFRDHPCPPIEFLKTGGDPFHDLAVHDIDYVCNLLGEYPTRVYAHGTSLSSELRAANVMDKASVWLEFPQSGVVCTMDLSRSAVYGYDQRIEVAGENGMLQVTNPRKTSLVQAGGHGIMDDTLLHSFPERFREAYLLELDHFVDVLDGTAQPQVHWNAARMATVVSEAARIAAIEKKIVTLKYDKTKQNGPHSEPHIVCEYEY